MHIFLLRELLLLITPLLKVLLIFKNCAPFTNCISKINNMQIDNAKDIDIVMPMYNLIEYSDNYAKTTGSLWQYCKDIPARNNDDEIADFAVNNVTDSFNFKAKITGQTEDDGTKDVEIMVPLKYLKSDSCLPKKLVLFAWLKAL